MKLPILTAALVGTLVVAPWAQAVPTLEATYTFNNNLDAQESDVAALTATNPLGTNAFGSATVFGNTRTIYTFNSSAGNNAGLTCQPGRQV